MRLFFLAAKRGGVWTPLSAITHDYDGLRARYRALVTNNGEDAEEHDAVAICSVLFKKHKHLAPRIVADAPMLSPVTPEPPPQPSRASRRARADIAR